ncbi:MAG: chemotaxis protein CheB [Daejeonella sp.]
MAKSKTITNGHSSSKIIVIGTSAGGLDALLELTSQLTEDFPAPILVVRHISPDNTGQIIIDRLIQNSTLKCSKAKNGGKLLPGHIYIAPPDHHFMVDDDQSILLTKGAQENRSRPSIDPLFRSAAVVFGNNVIGIVLTGYLDDGTAGLKVIKRCGGVCIIQDPDDAQYPDMPKNALNQVKADYCVPISAMGELLNKLVLKVPGKRKPVPKDILIETEIAKRVLSDLPSVNALGEQVPFNCPGCGGVLWKVDEGKSTRYRCHTGHAYTAAALVGEQTMKIEETMWVALRMFEERKNLLTTISKDQIGSAAQSAVERIKASDIHINRIKAILKANDK